MNKFLKILNPIWHLSKVILSLLGKDKELEKMKKTEELFKK